MAAATDALQELYGLAPEDFVPRRSALVKAAKAAGDKELAAAIGALRKPSTAAGALNRTARAEPSAFADLAALGERLRAAQHDLDADELRSLMRDRHAVVAAAAERVRAAAAAEDRPLSDAVSAEVDKALHAALADPAFDEALRRGVLVSTTPGEVDLGALDIDLDATRRPPKKASGATTKATARSSRADSAPTKATARSSKADSAPTKATSAPAKTAAAAKPGTASESAEQPVDEPPPDTAAQRREANAAVRAAQAHVDELAARRAEMETEVRRLQAQLREQQGDERRAASVLTSAQRALDALGAAPARTRRR